MDDSSSDEDTRDGPLSLEDLNGWSKKSLQQWLMKRELKKTGNKNILINRIYRAINFGESDISSSDNDSTSSDPKSDLPNINELSLDWEDLTTTNCPPIRKEDVQNYFLYEKNPITGMNKNCNRQLRKAKKFSSEQYINNIQFNNVDETSQFCMVKALCKPSMRLKVSVAGGKVREHYNIFGTLVKQTGRIINASCNCKAGLSGVCSHIGGLFLTMAKVKGSCTSTGCTWLRPKSIRKPPSPKRVCEISFSNTEENKNVVTKPFPDTFQAGPCKDPDVFLADILQGLSVVCPSSVLYKTVCKSSGNISDILCRYQPNYMFADTCDISSTVCQSVFRDFTNDLHMSNKESEEVNNATRGQSCNNNWKETRKMIITASNFGLVCKRQEKTQPDNLIKQLRGYHAIPNTQSLQYGRRHEARARRAYVRHHMDTCSGNIHIKDMGVHVSTQYPYLGASVDGLISCSVCGVGVLEIKCPYGRKQDKWRQKTPLECAENQTFCCQLVGPNKLSLKSNHNYYYQVIGQLAVLNLKWADFFVWTKKGTAVERIMFDCQQWETMLYKLKDFYSRNFVAELHTERVKRGKVLYP